MRERRVPRRGEVVDPGKVEHPGPELAGDLDGPIDAAGIDDDDLVEDPPHRLQAMRQVVLLVSHDHGES